MNCSLSLANLALASADELEVCAMRALEIRTQAATDKSFMVVDSSRLLGTRSRRVDAMGSPATGNLYKRYRDFSTAEEAPCEQIRKPGSSENRRVEVKVPVNKGLAGQ